MTTKKAWFLLHEGGPKFHRLQEQPITQEREMKNNILFSATCVVCLGFSSQAIAHHSFAMFDQTKKVEISGTISDIQWTNPHVWIEVDVPNEDGTTEQWAIEFTSQIHLRRRGFPRDQINVGDEATFTLSPYADGNPGGRFYTLETEHGVIYRDPGAQREYEESQKQSD